jgi:hypothetical protein
MDVVLSVGRQHRKRSKLIQLASFGRYSHAALVISERWWFEADEKGCFPSFVRTNHAGFVNGERVLLMDLSEYREIQVYRHPRFYGLSEARRDEIRKRIGAAISSFNFHEYPELAKLAHAAHPPLRRFLIAVARWSRRYLRRFSAPIIPGKFCSEAVAHIFQEMEVPLFDDQRDSSEVSPSNIAQSLLEPLDAAKGPYPVGMVPNKELLELCNISNYGRAYGELLVATNRDIALVTEFENKFDTVIAQITKRNIEVADLAKKIAKRDK